jgi:hypothetical protein
VRSHPLVLQGTFLVPLYARDAIRHMLAICGIPRAPQENLCIRPNFIIAVRRLAIDGRPDGDSSGSARVVNQVHRWWNAMGSARLIT